MKVLTIVGARPQFVKAAAVSRAIAKYNENCEAGKQIEEQIVHTGQHFDANMSDIFFEQMQIPKPHHQLTINSLGHGAMTGRMLEEIERICVEQKPDCVMVYGDTNSTLAGALAARKLHIKVVHVEAGLRSFNMEMPEEVNRILTDRISDVLCCPTETAINNLKKEGYNLSSEGLAAHEGKVVNTGDVMQDAALYYSEFSAQNASVIDNLQLQQRPFILCTIHRANNTDDPERLGDIFSALQTIGKDHVVVLPIHPRTRKLLDKHRLSASIDENQLMIIEPVGYFDMIELLKCAQLVLTDSGGLQKEAFFFDKPCITMRDETEWVELLEAGVNILVGADKQKILAAWQHDFSGAGFGKNLYGGGKAADNIVRCLAQL
ncbi:MAG: UDP-N-acetylglucosamine 2-epimerase (non-hydrolyzing) [Pseudoalteromonas sp.]|uniref:non-hydrolyzing UDP-N-acetylglucosamine 2-epimerase n=1 Tax=Pseudoalteromonas sp. TaxID=53249 RepID=UPI000C9364E7|nr:UDP-N-acetylglucosamine 2-epimerase (non-hydrolyzing) [Pseudoalteromonas sp.]MAD02211.1 UDP-N-acetylglucosamine 2-epimerase (non-hydrolyzing) [Pseudoalteromonas sp.]|tara:strand:+ start:66266 stop:67396 length:1131 start_codon:yes stop_codon:yes gene_type:complete